MKRTIISLVVFAGMFGVGAASNAQPPFCSTATLDGGYGFFANATILPAGTPRAILGRVNFDGHGNFTNTLTMNNAGIVTHLTDSGTYVVNADCTGKFFTNGSTGPTIEIVIVGGGKEFYQLRTVDPHIFFMFNAAKKQFPSDNSGDNQ